MSAPTFSGGTATPPLTSSDSSNWSILSSAPANGSQSVSNVWYSSLPTGNQYILIGYFRSSGSATTATYAAGVAGVTRAISGLTVGNRYRVNVAAEANVLYYAAGSSSSSMQRQPLALGVQGIGRGASSASGGWLAYEFTATSTSHVVELVITSSFNAFGGSSHTSNNQQYAELQEYALYVEDLFASSTAPYTLKTLTRSDDNGTRSVRLYEGQGLSDGVLVTTDPEPALTGLVSYTAVVHNSTSGTDTTVNASATLAGSVGRSRLAPASVPSQGQWFDYALDLSMSRDTTSVVTQVINRPDPLVTLGSQTLRSGTLTVYTPDYQSGAALEAVFNRGEVVFMRQPDYPGLDMYLVGTRTSLTPQVRVGKPAVWTLAVDYTEVTAPTTPLRGSLGWTIAESLARNATLAASRAEFPTVLDLLIGPES